jgi:hypothetical protein
MPFLKKSPPWQIALMVFAVAWVGALILRYGIGIVIISNATQDDVAVTIYAGRQQIFAGTVRRYDIRSIHYFSISDGFYVADITRSDGRTEHREFDYVTPGLGGHRPLFIYPE